MIGLKELKKYLEQSSYTTLFTGAGISVKSGIPTIGFEDTVLKRDLKLKNQIGTVTLSSKSFAIKYPGTFYRAYRDVFLNPIFKTGPNISHRVIARLEQDNKVSAIVTSNIDYLHKIAGSKHVIELWGSLNLERCTGCGRIYSLSVLTQKVPKCKYCDHLIIPDVIYRNLAPYRDQMDKASEVYQKSDLIIAVGSSGIYTSLPRGKRLVVINPNKSRLDDQASLVIREKAEDVFSTFYKN